MVSAKSAAAEEASLSKKRSSRLSALVFSVVTLVEGKRTLPCPPGLPQSTHRCLTLRSNVHACCLEIAG